MHKVLVNCLGGLSLPRKSVVRLTDRPDMTLKCLPWTLNNNTIQCFHGKIRKIIPLTLLILSTVICFFPASVFHMLYLDIIKYFTPSYLDCYGLADAHFRIFASMALWLIALTCKHSFTCFSELEFGSAHK